MRTSSPRITLAAAVIMLFLLAPASHAGVPVTKSFQMPMHLDLAFDTSECSNAPGPQIIYSGTLALAGLRDDLVFSNNAKGTHTYTDDRSIETVIVPEGNS